MPDEGGLVVSRHLYLAIVSHALSSEDETCGLLTDEVNGRLMGDHGDAWWRGIEFVPCRNVSEHPEDSYLVHPDDQLLAAGEGRKLVGMVHSHPRGEHRPSDWDRESYVPEGWWYVVVGLSSGQPKVGCYRKERGLLAKKPLIVLLG